MHRDLASTNDELHVLHVSRADVEKWVREWEITPSEKGAFLERLVGVSSKAGQSCVLCPSLRFTHRRASLSVQRHGLPLQARARPLARPRVPGDTACSARRDRHVRVRPDHLRL